MQAALALLVVLLWQLAFWLLLRTGHFFAGLGANVVFWCVAFPAWAAGARRWGRTSATPDAMLALTLVVLTAASFSFAQGDVSEAARDAWGWVGLSGVPVGLIATLFATLRARALRRARDITGAIADTNTNLGPKPVTVLMIAASILAVALAAFAVLIAVAIPGPR